MIVQNAAIYMYTILADFSPAYDFGAKMSRVMRCNLHVHGALPDPVGETAGEDDTNQLQEGNTKSNACKEIFLVKLF